MKAKPESKNCCWTSPKHFLKAGLLLSLFLIASRSAGQNFEVLHEFVLSPGGGGFGMRSALMPGSDGMLYGTSFEDTNSTYGKIYKLNHDGSDYKVLKRFTNLGEGAYPRWLALSGTTIYGCADIGGISNNGLLFQMNTDGSDYHVIKQFSGKDGNQPMCMIMDNTTLYGTTSYGGISNCGTVFKINADGTDYAILKDFFGPEGKYPVNILLSGTTLYGATQNGGNTEQGTIFSIQTDGTDFTVLTNFDGLTMGASPFCGLVSNATLYGTATFGGSLGGGTVFKLNVDGSDFEVLKAFTVSSSEYDVGPGLVLVGTTLFGSTLYETNSVSPIFRHKGTVFKVDVNGSNYTVIHRFSMISTNAFATNVDGAMPWAPLCLIDTDLFGTTEQGGRLGHGTVFRISIGPPVVETSPLSQTVEVGSDVTLKGQIGGSTPLMSQWILNTDTVIGDSSTNAWLKLTNVQPHDSGNYAVVVTNLFGAATSSPAMLNVIPLVERRSVADIRLIGDTGSSLHLEYTESMGASAVWLSLGIVNMPNPLQTYFDVTKPLSQQRFYRVWQDGKPAAPPALQLRLIPAITLNGNIGDVFRVDSINKFGPTNAWETLDTVTLTNTPQLYFDDSAMGQPPRLYRIVPMP